MNNRATILVVDDQETNIEMMIKSLEEHYEIAVALSGEEALEIALADPPDLVLLDVRMPGIDGFETCKRLRAAPQTKNIPVIFVTAMDEDVDEAAGLAIGADDYIAKPFNPSIVRLRVRNLIERAMMARTMELSLSGANQGLWESDGSLMVKMDPRWIEPLGYAPMEIAGKAETWTSIIHKDDIKKVESSVSSCLRGEVTEVDVEARVKGKFGDWKWMAFKGKPSSRGEAGKVIRLAGTFHDIGRRMHAEEELRNREAKLTALISAMQDVVILIDPKGVISHAHTPQSGRWPFSNEYMQGRPAINVFPERAREAYESALRLALVEGNASSFEFELTSNDIASYFHANASRVQGEKGHQGFLIVLRDITERRRLEEAHKNMALSDPLTGLPNRRMLSDKIGASLAVCRRTGSRSALLFIDLDRFKMLNDTQGHDAGDALLVEVAKRLKSETRESDTVARVGGDEFVILIESLPHDESSALSQMKQIGEKIRQTLDKPYDIMGKPFRSSPSIGVSIICQDTGDALSALKQADMAMYAAKKAGRNNVKFYDAAMGRQAFQKEAETERLRSELMDTLVGAGLFLEFQPVISGSGSLIEVESFVRWDNPSSGMLGPDDFIPMAETCGLLAPLGSWVMTEALCKIKMWEKNLQEKEARISVNVSSRQFSEDGFVEEIISKIVDKQVSPSMISLEITENAINSCVNTAKDKIDALRNAGFSITLDDFGAGSTSMNVLGKVDVNMVKIDKRLIESARKDAKGKAMLNAICGAVSALGIPFILEGIETKEDFVLIEEMGASGGQGYHFAKPMSEKDMEEKWL